MNFKFGHLWAKYQGYSLTFWAKMAHVHHFSMCNQNEWISNLVIFGQTIKTIALLFGQKWLIFITFQCAIKMNEFQIWSGLGKILRVYTKIGMLMQSRQKVRSYLILYSWCEKHVQKRSKIFKNHDRICRTFVQMLGNGSRQQRTRAYRVVGMVKMWWLWAYVLYGWDQSEK